MTTQILIQKPEYLENHEKFTDKYFQRSKQILKAEGINPIVRYQVFARQDIDSLKGVDEAVAFVKEKSPESRVYALRDGMNYASGEPLMKIEGRAQDLVDLETVYLEILSGNLTGELDFDEVRRNARAVRQAAGNKTLLYFGARHFHPLDDEIIANICYEEGFAGCSTDVGAMAWNAFGGGTVPHSLVLSYEAYMREQGIKGNLTVEAAKAFDRNIDKRVPRVMLIDTYNRELTDAIETAKAVPNLKGVRIDTCGENYVQGTKGKNSPLVFGMIESLKKKYVQGKGVTIQGVWALRDALDRAGFKDLEITVSSGFNAEKTNAFMQADQSYGGMTYGRPLFNIIGTGSLTRSVMTTSDIVAHYSEAENKWMDLSKVGRSETHSKRLEEVL